jgi:alkylation response protein AidB-like acyl-CoA dehydrogenase
MDAVPSIIDRVKLLTSGFAERAPAHDRTASFPFENFRDLADSGLLTFPVARKFGGGGASISDAARVIGLVGQADPATALVLIMHYMHHLVIARGSPWPEHLIRRIVPDVGEVALINTLRVEPDLGSPSRGGLPATVADPEMVQRLRQDR